MKVVANNTNLPVYLKDAITGGYTDLKATSEVSFTTTTTETANRYSLVFARPVSITNYGLPITVYPNPAKASVTIKGNHIATVEIIDNIGKMVGSSTLHNAINPIIPTINLSAGVYQLRIQTTDGKVNTVSFIKE